MTVKEYLLNQTPSAKQSRLYFIICLLAIVVILGAMIAYTLFVSGRIKVDMPEQKSVAEIELEKLEKMRAESAPLPEKVLKQEVNDLERLRQKTKASEEDLNKQIEELNNLRNE